jgi:hypothetical protein
VPYLRLSTPDLVESYFMLLSLVKIPLSWLPWGNEFTKIVILEYFLLSSIHCFENQHYHRRFPSVFTLTKLFPTAQDVNGDDYRTYFDGILYNYLLTLCSNLNSTGKGKTHCHSTNVS